MEDEDDSPQLKGVVIITLPPPENPSIGKTITAFTLSASSTAQEPPPLIPPTDQTQPTEQNQDQELNRFFLNRSRFGSPRKVLGFLGISLIAVFFWASLSQETSFELRDAEDDRGNSISTFFFPLYPKMGDRGDSRKEAEFKLGRFVDPESGVDKREFAKPMVAAKIDSTAVLPVRGKIYPDGLYYTYVLVGDPPKPYFLDIDTGSDLTWVQCDAPCTSCAKGAHPFYKPTRRNIIPSRDSYCIEVQHNQRVRYCETCQQCDYEIEYADHSSSIGLLARDDLRLMIANGTLSKFNVVFGCAYDQQGLLLNTLTKTDGLLGLSRSKISFPSQLANYGVIKNVVGHCLTSDSVGGGYMFLGNDFVPHLQMAWVPMLNRPNLNFYQTELFKMSYGGKELELGGEGRVVFDTGSSYTYFTEHAYNDLVRMLKGGVSQGSLIQDILDDTLPICWKAKSPIRSISEVSQFFKPLNLQFGSKWWIVSTKLHIPPEGYLIISNRGNVCLGILDGIKVHDGSSFILGDISLRGRLFVYDNMNERIGWIRSNCARPQKIQSFNLLRPELLQ